MKNNTRRNLIGAAAAALTGAAAAPAQTTGGAGPERKVHYRSGKKPAKTPLFSSAVSYGNLLFIAGKGAHFEGDIKAHTKAVLDDIEKELVHAGSSMDKVLKCNVYLSKPEHYGPMNEVFLGRFGENPPVRTTIAAAWIPGDSLVEMDVIAFI